jgi:hypothetical protein
MKSTSSWQWVRCTVVVALALLAVACGGGGGGGGGDASTPTDPSGTTPPANTTTTGTPSLLDPAIISRAGEGGNYPPMVAIDNAGNALAVWRLEKRSILSPEGLSEELLARRYVAGSGWQAIETIAGPTTKQSLESAVISMDKTTGKTIVVWNLVGGTVLEPGSSLPPSSIVSRAFDPASGWAAPLVVETNKPVFRGSIALGIDASGNAITVWNRFEASQTRIYASRYAAGGNWDTAVRIENDTDVGGGGGGQQIAFLPNGDALVVFNSSRGGTTTNIWGNKYTVGSGWGTNALVMSGSGAQTSGLIRFVSLSSLTADASGNAILTFDNQQEFASPFRYELNLWSKRYSGGAWAADSSAVPVGPAFTCSNCPFISGSRLKVNASGQAVATWIAPSSTNAGVTKALWASRSKSDGTWEPQIINNGISEFFANDNVPDVGIDDLGNIAVVWSPSSASAQSNIYLTRYTPSAGWVATELIESYSGTAEQQRIAMNARGSFMTLWSQFDNAIGTVIASRYYSSGR